MARAALAFVWLLAGCDGSSTLLVVDLRTDFVVPDDFDRISLTVRAGVREPFEDVAELDERAMGAADHLAGVRVGRFADLDPGEYTVRAALLAGGAEVSATSAVVDVRGRTAVTLTLSRACQSIDCPGQRCFNGECVDPRCTPETPEACPPGCVSAADCGTASACSDVSCADSECFVVAVDEACPSGRACHPVRGCGLPIGVVSTGLDLPTVGAIDLDDRGRVYLSGSQPSGGMWALSVDSRVLLRWSRVFATDGATLSRGVRFLDDRVYVSAWFTGALRIDGMSVDATPSQDGALAALRGEDGMPLWLEAFGGGGNTQPQSLSVLPDGRLMMAGHFVRSVSLDDFALSSVTPSDDWFAAIARVDATGATFEAAAAFGGDSSDLVGAAIPDGAGGTVVCGYSDAALAGEDAPATPGDADIVVMRADGDATPSWYRRIGSPGADGCDAIARVPGGMAIAGLIAGQVDDPTTGGPIGRADAVDAVVARIDGAGELIWIRAFGAAGPEGPRSIATTEEGQIFVAGTFTGTATFGETTLEAEGGADGYVVSLTPSGDVRWASALTGSGTVGWVQVATRAGRLVVAARFSDELRVGTAVLSGRSAQDVVVAFLDVDAGAL